MADDERYLFALSKKDYWKIYKEMPLIKSSCPGGSLEEGETPQKALVREVMEETACNICVVSSKNTYCFSEGTIEKIELDDDIKPVIVYEREQTSGNHFWNLMGIIFYVDILSGDARPSSEVPALLYAKNDAVVGKGEPKRLKSILDGGGELIESSPNIIPLDAYIESGFTSHLIAGYLGDRIKTMHDR